MTKIPDIQAGQRIRLPATGSWPESVHLFGERDAWAIKAAVAAGRPLLVRGKPGVGKSQLARAAAEASGRLFLSEVVHSRSEPEDLKWHFDAVARLGEAQALGALGGRDAGRVLHPRRFLSPGPLWWAFDHKSASDQNNGCYHRIKPPWREGWTPADGVVLLIDEIDKAEADLPNGLLEVLGNGGFSVPYRDDPICHHAETPPLVIVTTNEERELPGAFVRRCLVLRLELPKEKDAFVALLKERGGQHHPNISDTLRCVVAARLWEDRGDAREAGLTPPGQAEYLDILRALEAMTEDASGSARVAAQLDLFEHIADFALQKTPDEP